MLNQKILFIGGGNMAEGIIRGLLLTQTFEPDHIIVREIVDTRKAYLTKQYGITISENYHEDVQASDIIVLAVHPEDVEAVVKEVKADLNPNQLIISICAAVNLEKLHAYCGEDMKIARVMPNVLIEPRRGYSAAVITDHITDTDKALIEDVFNAIGKTTFIPENLFDEFTCAIDCSAAYIMYFISAMIDATVEAGFGRDQARAMVIEAVEGGAQMLAMTGKHPYEIVDTMTSPAGVTIEAIHVLERSGFKGIIMDAIRASINRSKNI